jgi:signal peptidase I
MIETLLRDLADSGTSAVTAPPYLAERVLARSRRRRRTAIAAVLAASAVGASVAARSGGQSRYVAEYEPSSSMGRTVAVGENLIADRELAPALDDVVVLTADGTRMIRRVTGLPGDTVACPAGPDGLCHGWTRNGVLLDEPYADGNTGSVVAPVRVGPGQVYVLGDQRDNAIDSRRYATPARLVDVVAVGVQVKDVHGHARPVAGAPAHQGPDGSNVDPAVQPSSESVPAS